MASALPWTQVAPGSSRLSVLVCSVARLAFVHSGSDLVAFGSAEASTVFGYSGF